MMMNLLINHLSLASSGPQATPDTIYENQSSTLSVTASDPDGDSLSYSWSASLGTISGTGNSVSYTPVDIDTDTLVNISVTVDDGKGGSVSASTELIVKPVIIPEATLSIATVDVQQGQSAVIVPVDLSSTVPDIVTALNFDVTYEVDKLVLKDVTIAQAAIDAAKTLSYSQPQSGLLRVIIFSLSTTTIADGPIANLLFDVKATATVGVSKLKLSEATATDAQANTIDLTTVDGELNITSRPNQAPVLTPIENQTIKENELLQFTISATDVDNDSLSFSVQNLPTGASFIDNQDNTAIFSWTPTYTQAGVYSDIQFEVTDGELTDTQTITITVIDVKALGLKLHRIPSMRTKVLLSV
jgi:hypothetical protein